MGDRQTDETFGSHCGAEGLVGSQPLAYPLVGLPPSLNLLSFLCVSAAWPLPVPPGCPVPCQLPAVHPMSPPTPTLPPSASLRLQTPLGLPRDPQAPAAIYKFKVPTPGSSADPSLELGLHLQCPPATPREGLLTWPTQGVQVRNDLRSSQTAPSPVSSVSEMLLSPTPLSQ